ncbi:MAG: hypothetical protein QOE01_2765 [Actinomycetota bacterium]|nr:hypothetical protein [Actinomycetota bacterium]
MRYLLLTDLAIGATGLLVLLFVAFPYRGRAVPRAERVGRAVEAVAERVDPGEAPAHGILTDREGSRRMARRFEVAERGVRRKARAATRAIART